MRRRTIAPHLELAELERRYRQATDATTRSHWQLIWLLSKGYTTAAVVDATSYSPAWIATLVQRYNRDGPQAFGDRRHLNPGAARLLSPQQRSALEQALDGPAPDGGVWSGPKVAQWMADQLGHPVHAPRGWELLQQLGYRSYVPRPRHLKADPTEQEAFKKNA